MPLQESRWQYPNPSSHNNNPELFQIVSGPVILLPPNLRSAMALVRPKQEVIFLSSFLKKVKKYFVYEYSRTFFQVVFPGDVKPVNDEIDCLAGIAGEFHFNFSTAGIPLHKSHEPYSDMCCIGRHFQEILSSL
ncbi:hypothetical protein ES703_52891 [subsurface metagenome]